MGGSRWVGDRKVASKTLLLVRGLLDNRFLLLYPKKQWNVQYGVRRSKNGIAVLFEVGVGDVHAAIRTVVDSQAAYRRIAKGRWGVYG